MTLDEDVDVICNSMNHLVIDAMDRKIKNTCRYMYHVGQRRKFLNMIIRLKKKIKFNMDVDESTEELPECWRKFNEADKGIECNKACNACPACLSVNSPRYTRWGGHRHWFYSRTIS